MTKAKYPVIDMHAHAYAKTPEQVDRWVQVMDAVGIDKTVILAMTTGQRVRRYRGVVFEVP